MAYFIAFASYSFILFLEKVAFDSHALTEHTHHYKHKDVNDHEDIKDDKNEPLLQDEELIDENDDGGIRDSNQIKKSLANTRKEKHDMADEYFISQNTSHPQRNEIFHNCFAVKHSKKIVYEKSKGNLTDEDIDSDQDENTIKHIVTGKGKFISYLHARNLSKIHINY